MKNHKIHNKYNRDQCQVPFLTTFCRILFISACLIFKHNHKWVSSSLLATSYLGPNLPERPWERDCTLGALCAAFHPHLCLAHDHCSHAPARFSSLMSMPFSFALVCKVFNPYVAGLRLFRAGLCTWLNEYFIKGAVSRQSSSFCLILPITRPQSLWNLKWAKKSQVNDKIRDPRQKHMSPEHYVWSCKQQGSTLKNC